jgi:hypothetical protein
MPKVSQELRSAYFLLYNQAYVNLLHPSTNHKGEKGRLLASAEQSCKEQEGTGLTPRSRFQKCLSSV